MSATGFSLWTAVLLASLPLTAQNVLPLERRISREINRSALYQRSILGIHVVELAKGKTLYSRNMDRMFVPASNAKLVTTAAALTRLGPEYRYKTHLVMEPSGDLVLVGGGDPTLSSRIYPYAKDSEQIDPLRALEDLVDQAIANGLTEVQGDIVGDDTRYAWDPFPSSWTTADAMGDDGPPVSALTFNDNILTIKVKPGAEPGDLAELEMVPGFEYFTVDNRVTTVARGRTRVKFFRDLRSNQLQLWGTVAMGDERRVNAAVDDPALFAAHALYDVLARRGIPVHGHPVARHGFEEEPAARPEGKVLAERVSLPLTDILRVVDKVSQNLHAEMLLLELGYVNRHQGTREAGIEELSASLEALGATKDDFRFEDGSGLSRNDLITPRALTRLLQAMWAGAEGDTYQRDTFFSLLPVGGEDGTLSNRMCCEETARSIHAKTGSLARSITLSGYAESKTHGMLAFSILVNNFAAGGAAVRKWIDKIALELVE